MVKKFGFAAVIAGAVLAAAACGSNSSTDSTASTTASAAASSEASASSASKASVVYTVSVDKDGNVKTADAQPSVKLGTVVEVQITSAIEDEVHNHVTDAATEIKDGKADLVFTADKPGKYELELENHKITLLELTIS